jgi:hypothetical protein
MAWRASALGHGSSSYYSVWHILNGGLTASALRVARIKGFKAPEKADYEPVLRYGLTSY